MYLIPSTFVSPLVHWRSDKFIQSKLKFLSFENRWFTHSPKTLDGEFKWIRLCTWTIASLWSWATNTQFNWFSRKMIVSRTNGCDEHSVSMMLEIIMWVAHSKSLRRCPLAMRTRPIEGAQATNRERARAVCRTIYESKRYVCAMLRRSAPKRDANWAEFCVAYVLGVHTRRSMWNSCNAQRATANASRCVMFEFEAWWVSFTRSVVRLRTLNVRRWKYMAELVAFHCIHLLFENISLCACWCVWVGSPFFCIPKSILFSKFKLFW